MRVRNRSLVVVLTALLAVGLMPASAHASPDDNFVRYDAWFNPGPVELHAARTQWVPQGLTNLGSNRLVTSYYDSAKQYRSIIVITDLAGNRLKGLWLNGVYGHVGGLAATANYLWVTDAGTVLRYSRATIDATPDGGSIDSEWRQNVQGKASYAYAQGETVWVGDFNWDTDGLLDEDDHNCPEYNQDYATMYRYTVNPVNGLLQYVGSARTPGAVQGVTVTSNRFIWSSSCGRDNHSHLIVWDRAEPYDGSNDYGNIYTTPNMSEGITLVGSKLYLVFESASAHYADSDVRTFTIERGNIPEAYGDGLP